MCQKKSMNETYIPQKKPMKETNKNQKKPTKETYIHQIRPTNIKRDWQTSNQWCKRIVHVLNGVPIVKHCNTLQHTATYCNTLHHSTTHCNARGYQRRARAQAPVSFQQHIVVHYNLLQHTCIHCNSLQHTLQHTWISETRSSSSSLSTTHCNALQHSKLWTQTPRI